MTIYRSGSIGAIFSLDDTQSQNDGVASSMSPLNTEINFSCQTLWAPGVGVPKNLEAMDKKCTGAPNSCQLVYNRSLIFLGS
jgi:hypothetical protein